MAETFAAAVIQAAPIALEREVGMLYCTVSATVHRSAGVNPRADAFDNATLELITRWLKGWDWR